MYTHARTRSHAHTHTQSSCQAASAVHQVSEAFTATIRLSIYPGLIEYSQVIYMANCPHLQGQINLRLSQADVTQTPTTLQTHQRACGSLAESMS